MKLKQNRQYSREKLILLPRKTESRQRKSAECCELRPPYCLQKPLRVQHARPTQAVTQTGLSAYHLAQWEPVLPGRPVLTNGKRSKKH